ncbi:methionine aminopeptidase [Paenibacillus sp. TCA20]|uniref:type I methionyl aminopeptidase n=1 Tax=Paenibacillus sp. TCA20 TaxID=1499968 RepID=UPI0004D48E20|nr:type I methionyl aminopeptidase [Paenibacillus sp. TCA20]GAK40358.1 methionine aminopeptidase [Paenibacillus sp. TCA20]
MSVILKTKEEIGYMREAGRILKACHRRIESMLTPGITTQAIDNFVEYFLAEQGATPEQKGYKGYPYAICASVNEIVCHGFPSDTALVNGDVVTIDMVVNKDGWLADSAWTYAVGKTDAKTARFLKRTEKAMQQGIAQALPGKTVGDIGYAIEKCVKPWRYGIVKPLVGHGIGRIMHEQPDIFPYGKPGQGIRLEEGMVITVEPVLTMGPSGAVYWEDDGWTIRSADGSIGAQYEHTVAITKDGPLLLTV